jgi:hypothetical protein
VFDLVMDAITLRVEYGYLRLRPSTWTISVRRKPRPAVSRYRGALLSLAVGDALGTAPDFSPLGTFRPIDDMIGGGPFNPAGPPKDDLSPPERDVIRLALRGDLDLRRYVPEVMTVCAKFDISEPQWMSDEAFASVSS